MFISRFFRYICILLCCCLLHNGYAANPVVNLVVGYKYVNYTGKWVRAMAINNQIPGPTLHFKEGDHVTINVYNHLNVGTTLHWHGLLVPWQMDGVDGVTQNPIPPGGVFHYRFTLYQSGTYWYHSHVGFQEQQGLYGGIIIDPLHPSAYHYNKDYMIVLSDWSNTDPMQIYANLKKDGDYYESSFPLQASLVKFIHDYHHASSTERKILLNEYKMMQQMRMSIYDISDVAYDAFLLNGEPNCRPWTARVNVGDVVRLRFIGAAAITIFNVKIPSSTMKVVQVDGNDVRPYSVKSLSIAPGETYDVLVHITKNQPYPIYAESADTSGVAYGELLTEPNQSINYKTIKPFPEPAPVMVMPKMNSTSMKMPSSTSNHSMSNSMNMNMSMPMNMPMGSGNMNMNMNMDHSSTADIPMTTGTKYQNLIAAVKTNDPNVPIQRVIHMDLSGYMSRYIWFINGVPEFKSKPILLKPGKRYRFIFTNSSMMHHPMHLHGHWFILRNGHGAYDPLLHTIDVPPGATAVADVDTDASGQWIFHCHMLYHMMGGMTRIFQYTTLIDITKGKAKPENITKKLPYTNQAIVRVDKEPINTALVNHPIVHSSGIFAANFLDIDASPFQNNQALTYKGLFGSDYNKLEIFSNDAEINDGSVDNADADIFYWHLLSEFWAIKGGANYVYRPATTPYWQPGIGLEGLMPYFIDTDIRMYYHDGSTKLDLELSRDTQITNNFFIQADIRSILASKTVNQDFIGNGLNEFQWSIRPFYRLNPTVSVYVQYQDTQNYGTTKQLLQQADQATNQKIVSVGLSLLF